MQFALRRLPVLFLVGAWGAAVAAGLGALWVHGASAGSDGQPAARWPHARVVEPAPGKANLVMAVHPYCPCTRASLAELARLMARAEGKVEAHLLFFAPAAMGKGWERSALWEVVAAIPGVHPVVDAEGAETARFGLETSGHVVLYDARGKLAFSGGITEFRGHEGDNDGLDAALAAATGRTPPVATHPVFGCAISRATTAAARENAR